MKKKDLARRRTKSKCAYCGVHLLRGDTTLDHVTPKAFGGVNDIRNMVATCHRCNNQKRDLSVEEFRELYPLKEFWIEKLEGKKLRGYSDVVWSVVEGVM